MYSPGEPTTLTLGSAHAREHPSLVYGIPTMGFSSRQLRATLPAKYTSISYQSSRALRRSHGTLTTRCVEEMHYEIEDDCTGVSMLIRDLWQYGVRAQFLSRPTFRYKSGC